jgi:hypothetical protein
VDASHHGSGKNTENSSSSTLIYKIFTSVDSDTVYCSSPNGGIGGVQLGS